MLVLLIFFYLTADAFAQSSTLCNGGAFCSELCSPKDDSCLNIAQDQVDSNTEIIGLDLYHTPASSPCRAVRLVATALEIELNLKPVDLLAREQYKPEYLKINPQHTVPTLIDNGFILWESRAIMGYLVNQYGKNDSLYPKNPKARAVVDQRLYFDIETMYSAFTNYLYPILFFGEPEDKSKYEKIKPAFELLDKFLENQNYLAGDHLTIADLALIVTVSNFELIKYDICKYKNVTRWARKIKAEAVKYEEINGEGLKAFQSTMDILLNK